MIRLQGQGPGGWPTTVSVMGDLHEVASKIEGTRQQNRRHTLVCGASAVGNNKAVRV